MQTLQVQPAGAVAATPSSSMGAPADQSFAITLGRALGGMSDGVEGSPSLSAKSFGASPRGKGTTSSDNGASLLPAIPLNPVVAIPPAPVPEMASDSPLGFASSLNHWAGENDTTTGTLAAESAISTLAGSGTPTAWAELATGATGSSKGLTANFISRQRGPTGSQSGSAAIPAGQEISPDMSAALLASVPAATMQGNPLVSESEDQQLGQVLSEPSQVQAPPAKSPRGSGAEQKSTALPSLAVSGFRSEPLGSAQVPTSALSPSDASLPSTYTSVLSWSQLGQAPATPASGADDSGQLDSARVQNAASSPSESNLPTAYTSVLSLSQWEQDMATPSTAPDHPEMSQVPTMPESLGAAAMQSVPNASGSQREPEQVVGASSIPVGGGSTQALPATDHPEVAEFSSLLSQFGGAEMSVQGAGNAPMPANAMEKPAAVPSKSEARVSAPVKAAPQSTPVSARVEVEVASQKPNAAESASVQTQLSSSADQVNAQAATSATTWQKGAPPKGNVVELSGTTSSQTAETTIPAMISNSSAGGQGKSGQQSGQGTG